MLYYLFGLAFTAFFQINLGIYIQNSSTELSVLVDRSVGGTSLVDGQIELMLHRSIVYDSVLRIIVIIQFYSILVHFFFLIRIFALMILKELPLAFRRLLHDDSRGVGEVLNETVCVLDKCEGLTVSIIICLIQFFPKFPWIFPYYEKMFEHKGGVSPC